MDNLEKLKNKILRNKSYTEELETCYQDFLDEYNPLNASLLINLLEMVDKTPRVAEIFKVYDLIRFPVKKPYE